MVLCRIAGAPKVSAALTGLPLLRFGTIGLTIATNLVAGSILGQVLMSAGTHSQNFDTLASSTTGNTNWTDNTTLLGWYASKTLQGGAVTNYRVSYGNENNGALYSYGASGSTDRALGSIASGTPGNFAYGVRFTNDTAVAQTNFTISYTGEQWRNGGNTNAQRLAFSCCISGTAITNSDAAATLYTWTAFTSLDFTTPTVGSTNALDGNASTNRQVFTNVLLSGVVVQPGQEVFFRWFDTNNVGYDHGVAIDDLTIGFQAISNSPPSITAQPQSQTVAEGTNVTFTVGASGSPPPIYQWQFNGTDLPAATNATLTLTNVTVAQSGSYIVVVTNSVGSTNSQPATLVVESTSSPLTAAFSLLTYNVKGNSVTNWSTNSLQVQAIGRQMQYLQPDIITFQEIPYDLFYEMTNFVTAYLPGYFLATNSTGDNYIRSVIASRFPITRSQSWLGHADLNPFGYTNSNFTRDLFEAQISVPGFAQPVHVFTTHLKSGSASDDIARRAAEASAISNYFVTGFLTTNASHPYVLSGDMNESNTNQLSIQRLISAPTGLRLTTPTNPFTGSELTHSIQSMDGLTKRFDYIMPGGLLFSNIVGSQVFRTDLLTNPPPPLLTNDDRTASDHLPVLMVFGNPFDTAFRLLSVGVSNEFVTLKWESAPGRQYRVESSSNLTAWAGVATNLVATATNLSFTTNAAAAWQFYRVYRVP